MQNTAHVSYRMLEGNGCVRLRLRPSVHFRPHEGPVEGPTEGDYKLEAREGRYEIIGPKEYPALRLRVGGERCAFTIDGHHEHDLCYRIEKSRGYDFHGQMWSPGYFR